VSDLQIERGQHAVDWFDPRGARHRPAPVGALGRSLRPLPVIFYAEALKASTRRLLAAADATAALRRRGDKRSFGYSSRKERCTW
jgi:hypothetical protein